MQERFEEDTLSENSSKSIYVNFKNEGGEVDSKTFGRYIHSVFQNVKITRKSDEYFYNLKEKAVERLSDVTYDISLIHQWIVSPFFICQSNEEEVHLAIFCELVNGNQLVKKIIFKRNGEWELYTANNQINLEDLSIENHFSCTRTSVQNVCSIVMKLNSCKGKEKENVTPDTTKNKNFVIEYLGEEKTLIYRSYLCKRILSPISKSSTCRNCQNSIRTLKNAVPVNEESKTTLENVTVSFNRSTSNNMERTHEEKDTDDKIILENGNNDDMKAILEKVLPEASDEMLDLLVNQKQNLERNPKGRRWDKKTISLCLSLWCRSRKNYQQLRDSKVLILPSGNTLQVYKNSVDQRAGFHTDAFLWMKEEAKKHYPSESSFRGGICIDEMSIQEDLCMVKTNGEVRLVGFVDMGPEAYHLNILCTGKRERELATHVLQFLYLGLNGFRFPFACFPVTQTKAANLHFLFWQAVKFLNIYEFKVLFVSMDGAQTNRDFMKIFFSGTSPLQGNFSTRNIWSPLDPEILFIMDYSHVIKRIRNNVLKSGTGKTYPRKLCYNQFIYWEHWVNAFKWDRETNAFPLHRKLTNDHLFLTQESKMRNQLAEDVMNDEMLRLMESFQKFLGTDGYLLNDSVALLRATSVIVRVFRDRRPVVEIEDKRLDDIANALRWFSEWETHVSKQKLTATEKDKQLMSAQTREDLNSCITGFRTLCRNSLKVHRDSVVPARINSDVIENIFCQQRGIINGNNTNPTFYQYVKNINAVIIGQNAVSKNSNAVHRGCDPLCFSTKKAVKRKRAAPSVDKDARKPLSTVNK